MHSDAVKGLIAYFAKENNCTILMQPDALNNHYIISMLKNGKWAKDRTCEIENSIDELVNTLNEMYQELIEGEQDDINRATD